jgi:leucyl/phenylalanyl-tRNA---protein transferase
MLLIDFPNPRFCRNADGVVCVSETDFLNPKNLLHAYKRGIFPWMIDGYEMVPWFCPPERAIIEFAELHVPKSLRKAQRRSNFTFTIDKAFNNVVYACAKIKRSKQKGTWITQDIYDSYNELFLLGVAHSVEVWEGSELVGGLYGVDAGGVFCGESMFHTRTNTSKLAFLHLAEHLKTRNSTWLDIQVMTPHFEILGAKEIPRNDFLAKLEHTLAQNLKLF